jgi:peptide/nickel transport system permease protein
MPVPRKSQYSSASDTKVESANEVAVTTTKLAGRRSNFWFGFGVAIVVIYALVGVIGPFIVNYDSYEFNTKNRLRPPGAILSDGGIAWLGTDQVGRDILAQVVQGARVSMMVGVLTLLISAAAGLIIGVLAGYFGGLFDTVLMRVADIMLAFPTVLLAIFIASVLGPSVRNLVITLALTNWVQFARVARGQTLVTKSKDYVDATRILGASHWHVLWRCIIPGCLPTIGVVATVQLGLVIITEASLSFLGVGTPLSTPSWGLTIANGRDYLGDAWWISAIPGIVLSLLVVTVGKLGDSLRDRADPNMVT